jgi:serine/threonine protein kinase
MAGTTEIHLDPLPDVDDELRSLLSAILDGRRTEQVYLRDVSALCRAKPQSGHALLLCIDRYRRLGRMPVSQHEKVKACIARALSEAAAEAFDAQHSGDLHEQRTSDLVAKPAVVVKTNKTQRSQANRHEASNDVPAAPRAPGERATSAPAPSTAARASPIPRLQALAPRPASAARPEVSPVRAPEAASSARPAIAGPDTEANAVGQVLRERYELQRIVGQGGMATVYQALDRYRASLDLEECLVALKVLRSARASSASARNLGREFHNAQRLSHPNVINVYEIDHDRDLPFYTMELLEGARLDEVLVRRNGAPLATGWALAIIRDIGAAITHAHERGVVHGDLKPSNVIITREGEVRVLDFGGQLLSPREPCFSELDDAGEIYCPATPAYASCEQLERQRPDPRDDIYALACIAYLLLAGKHPFDYLSAIEARAREMRPRRPPLLPLAPWRALRRGLAWSRQQRTMGIDEWLAQLDLKSAASALPSLPELVDSAAPRFSWRRAVALPLLALGATLVSLLSAPGSTLRNAWQELQYLAESAAPREPAAAPTVAQLPRASVASKSTASVPKPANAEHALVPAAALPAAGAEPAEIVNTPHVAFAADRFAVGDGEPAARIVVRRVGSSTGDLSFVWWTEAATAEPNVDYASLGRRTEHIASGQDKITVYVPIISNPLRQQSRQFRVALAEPDASHAASKGGAQTNASVTVTIERGS